MGGAILDIQNSTIAATISRVVFMIHKFFTLWWQLSEVTFLWLWSTELEHHCLSLISTTKNVRYQVYAAAAQQLMGRFGYLLPYYSEIYLPEWIHNLSNAPSTIDSSCLAIHGVQFHNLKASSSIAAPVCLRLKLSLLTSVAMNVCYWTAHTISLPGPLVLFFSHCFWMTMTSELCHANLKHTGWHGWSEVCEITHWSTLHVWKIGCVYF